MYVALFAVNGGLVCWSRRGGREEQKKHLHENARADQSRAEPNTEGKRKGKSKRNEGNEGSETAARLPSLNGFHLVPATTTAGGRDVDCFFFLLPRSRKKFFLAISQKGKSPPIAGAFFAAPLVDVAGLLSLARCESHCISHPEEGAEKHGTGRTRNGG